jgi:transcriptional regulator with XRE-family HTH domain
MVKKKAPPKSTAPLDEEAVFMGERLRALRTERGLTMVQFAELTGMSQPFVSLVERGHARLSLTSMARVAEALGIRSASLLAREPVGREVHDGVDVVHTAHRAAPGPEAGPGVRRVWQLAQLPDGLLGTELVGSDTAPEFTAHLDEDEFVYVLEGVLEVELDDGTLQTLTVGDSIALAAGRSHSWRALDPRGYRVLAVVVPRSPTTVAGGQSG